MILKTTIRIQKIRLTSMAEFFLRLKPGDVLMVEVDTKDTTNRYSHDKPQEVRASAVHAGTMNVWQGSLATLDYQLRIMFETTTI